MPRRNPSGKTNPAQEAARSFLINDQMNQLLLDHLAPQAWRAKLPGMKGRTVADIFSHVHNMRCKWLRLSAPHLKLPAQLNRTRCTPRQAQKALGESARLCSQMLEEALTSEGRVETFLRDGWARPWKPSAEMLAYMIAHEAHHRGQVCMLAHQLGFRLPVTVGAGIWNWEKLAKKATR